MLIRKNSVLLGWVLAAFAFIAVALVATTSPSFQRCFAKRGNFDTSTTKKATQRSLVSDGWFVVQCEGAFLDANSILLMVIAGIVIAGFAWEANERQMAATGAMADAAQRAVNVAERALTVGHRAFVFFKEVTSGRVVDSKTMAIKYWTITPVFENSGGTPTKHLLGRINYDFFDGEPPADFSFADTHRENDWSIKTAPARVLLAPKSTANIGGSVSIGIERMIELAKRQKALFLWGWVDYNDIFPATPRHRTEFCMQLVVEGDPSKVSVEGVPACRVSARYYHRHNAVDDECTRPPNPFS